MRYCEISSRMYERRVAQRLRTVSSVVHVRSGSFASGHVATGLGGERKLIAVATRYQRVREWSPYWIAHGTRTATDDGGAWSAASVSAPHGVPGGKCRGGRVAVGRRQLHVTCRRRRVIVNDEKKMITIMGPNLNGQLTWKKLKIDFDIE